MQRKSLVVFAAVSIMTALTAGSTWATVYYPDPEPGGGGGGGGSLWIRSDLPCPNDPNREKTICTSGGSEQCTAQYCN